MGLQVYLAHWGAVYPPPLKNEWGYYSPIRLLAIYFAVLTPVEMRWEGKGRMVDFAEVFVFPVLLILLLSFSSFDFVVFFVIYFIPFIILLYSRRKI